MADQKINQQTSEQDTLISEIRELEYLISVRQEIKAKIEDALMQIHRILKGATEDEKILLEAVVLKLHRSHCKVETNLCNATERRRKRKKASDP